MLREYLERRKKAEEGEEEDKGKDELMLFKKRTSSVGQGRRMSKIPVQDRANNSSKNNKDWATTNVGGNANSNEHLQWADYSSSRDQKAKRASHAHWVDRVGKSALMGAILLFNICFWTVAFKAYAKESDLGRLDET